METPIPRKFSKKTMKRRISAKHKFSQKKLKSAINVSLNTSQSLRSLRMNNRSLAHRVEGLKREMRNIIETYQSIRDENHTLRQRVVSMECVISDPDSYIEEQVKKRLEVRIREVKSVIQLLHDNVVGMSLNVKSLDEMCSSSKGPSMDRSRRSGSIERIMSKEPFPTLPLSMAFQNDENIEHFHEDTTINSEMNTVTSELDSFSSPTLNASEHGEQQQEQLLDMSMISEQSFAVGRNSSPLRLVDDLPNKSQKEEETSKASKQLFPKSNEARDISKKNELVSVKENIRKSRRKTHILSDDEINVLGITDVEPPVLSSPLLPSNAGDADDQRIDDKEPADENDQLNEIPMRSKEHRDSRAKTDVQQVKKSHSKSHKKAKVVHKREATSQRKECEDLFISNQFVLNNIHKKMAEKIKIAQAAEEIPNSCEIGNDKEDEDEEHTIHMVEDMELTVPLNADIKIAYDSMNGASSAENNSSDHENPEEMCPEAVVMQRMKPGQFKYAASRKESNGSRKSLLVQPPKARSKSKKVIAEMIENLPQKEPESIFDFHDKTPTLISGKAKDMSVYSLRDESSVMSPPTPLGKRGSRIQSPAKNSEEGTDLGNVKNVDNNENVTVRKSRSRSRSRASRTRSQSGVKNKVNEQVTDPHSVLGEGTVYNVPLKDDSDQTEKVASRKSRGRSRSRARSVVKDVEGRIENKVNEEQVVDPHSVLGEGTVYKVPLKDDSDQTEKDASRKSRGRSRSKARSVVKEVEGRIESEQVTESHSVLGEGTVYSVPLKDDSDQTAKVTNRKSRGRSRSRPRSVVKDVEGRIESEQVTESHSALGEGTVYNVPLKDDSDQTEKDTSRKSRGRSRSRARSVVKDVEGRIENEVNEEQVVDPHSVLGEGMVNSVPLKGDSIQTEKVTSRKLRGRSRSRARSVVKDVDGRIESEQVIESHSVLGEGTVYSVPLKDDSDQTAKVTIRKSRGRSRSRARSVVKDVEGRIEGEKVAESHSVLGEGTVYSVPLKDGSDQAEKVIRKLRGRSRSRARSMGKDHQLHDFVDLDEEIANDNSSKDGAIKNEITLRNSRSKSQRREQVAKSRRRTKSAIDCAVSENLDEVKLTLTNPETVLSLVDGTTCSTPLKDDSDRCETITMRKARCTSQKKGRPKKILNEEQLFDPGEASQFCQIMSHSRGHLSTSKKDSHLNESIKRPRSKSRGRAKMEDNFKKSDNLNDSGDEVSIESPKRSGLLDSEISALSDKKGAPKQSALKRGRSKLSTRTEEGTVEREGTEDSVDTSNTQSDERAAKCSKVKTPPKSLKKGTERKKAKVLKEKPPKPLPESHKDPLSPQRKKREGYIQKISSSPQLPQEEDVIQNENAESMESEARIPIHKDAGSDNLCNITAKVIGEEKESRSSRDYSRESGISEKHEETPQKVDAQWLDKASHEESKFSKDGIGKCEKRKKTNHERLDYSTIRDFHVLDRLQNLQTPDCFKTNLETKRSKSTSEETDLEKSADESSRRRRAACKSVSYVEPKLGGKLRRGDPFTSSGYNKLSIYKSPKGPKKKKTILRRDVLGPLQNHLVKEETSP